MKQYVLFLLACAYAHGAPVDPMKPGSCRDPSTQSAAELALTKINQDRKQGYVFSLNRLRNVNQMQHGPTGVVFYLTLDVLETKCHVLSKRDWKSCEVRQTHDTPVYGQCKATIYINKVQRVVRLYSYSCNVRPAPNSRISQICPDCPSQISQDDESVMKTVKMSLEKYNRERGIAVFYFVEFTIQETVCSNSTDVTEAAKCALMDCEFTHKGHCTGSHSQSHGKEYITVNCDIFEPEEAEKEKQRHLLGGEHGHSHNDTHHHDHAHDHTHDHDHAHDHDHDHTHDHGHHHAHDHAHGHTHAHNHSHDHAHDHDHDHTHDHTHDHDHAHDHTHEHGHDHVHNHAHDHTHNHTHDHSHDHVHEHGDHHHHHHHHHPEHSHGHNHTHQHEHEHDHEHKHQHLHVHEHHHHHHDHDHHRPIKSPKGTVHYLPDIDQPVIMPSFPDEPSQAVTLPVFPDAEVPENREPIILPFPSTISPQCPAEPKNEMSLIKELFADDPLFKH